MKTKVVNLYAGPGVGKSTTAAALFAELKYRGVNCELVQEPAKWGSWEQRSEKFFTDQVGLFARQNWKFHVLSGNVDIIINDSPLFLGLAYQPADYNLTLLRGLMGQAYAQYDNLDIYLLRDENRGYNPMGRNQDEAEAVELDKKILRVMMTVLPNFHRLHFSRKTPQEIIDLMVTNGWHNTVPKIINV